MKEIYEVLSESSELDKEVKSFEGYLTGFWMSSCKWSLKLDSGEEVSGKVRVPDLLYGVVSGEVRYKITCEEILEQNIVSSKEKTTLILTDIEEVKKQE